NVSATLSTLRVSIEYEKESPKWDIKHANLQEGEELWGMPAKKVILPTDKDEPYIVKNIPAGKYRLSLMRQDYVVFRQPIEVNETDVNVTIPIPKSTSGIHGHLTGKLPIGQTIWTRDKSIVGTIMPDAGLNYKLDNLPAGHYYLGGNMLIDSEAVLEFDLADGEQKILDINVPDSPENQKSPLLVMVLDENGTPLQGTKVRLLNGESAIEPMVDSSQGIYFTAEEGAYTLQVDFPGYKAVTQQVSIKKFDSKNIQALRKPVLIRLERQ
ncbi:MAG: carboxypeptidase-like regulatory domain-containing protein, partial [Phycisphaerae bacterium]